MRLILDANILHKFFNGKHTEFAQYNSVRRCLIEKKGEMFFGGKKFAQEFKKQNKEVIQILVQLEKAGRLRRINDEKVNVLENEIKKMESNKDFDDPHIIACIIISKCQIFVSDDKRADRFIKDKKFYPKRFVIPSIYRNLKHDHLMAKCF